MSEIFINEGDRIVTTRGRTITAGVDTAVATEATAAAKKVQAGEKTATKLGTSTGTSKATFETVYNSDPIAMQLPNGQQQVVFPPPLLNKDTKLVVLVNKGTASAAEIVSGVCVCVCVCVCVRACVRVCGCVCDCVTV